MYEVATQQSGEMVSRNTQTEMMISRQAQEVQGAMVIAKRFPRDEVESFNRIMQSCKRKSLAESAMYEYPRGGTKVSGPSIRLAEAMAQNWGNIDFGITELEQKNGESQVMAYWCAMKPMFIYRITFNSLLPNGVWLRSSRTSQKRGESLA